MYQSPMGRFQLELKLKFIFISELHLRHIQLAKLIPDLVGLDGLGVTCSPRDTRFTSSNPAEVDGFFQDVKILSTSPPGGTLS